MESKDLFIWIVQGWEGLSQPKGTSLLDNAGAQIRSSGSVTNKAFEAEEACRAAGAETCKFRIHFIA
jgi:hypothetical protein